MNIKELLRRCSSFYKKANLEEDMAKRIMLSIIPSVMTPTERQSTMIDPAYWGLDYRALKSAANGVKDLVKYGTLACAEELGFYLNARVNVSYQVKRLAGQGEYIAALNLAEKTFLDLPHWNEGYGREPWAKIANVLKQLEEKRQFLDMVREESKSSKKDPHTNYETLEIETMKEIIVLMNVFDGLAHNSGNILPKLMWEEVKELSPETYDPNGQERMLRMMDAKELNNPIDVYREIQHIMDQPMYKSTFGEWISRLRRSPEYHAPQDIAARKLEIEKVKLKKYFKTLVPKLESIVGKMVQYKDKLINIKDPYEQKSWVRALNEMLFDLRQYFSAIYSNAESYTYSASYPSHVFYRNQQTANYYQNIMQYCNKARNELSKMYDQASEKFDEQEVVSMVHRVKRMVSGLESIIDSL